MAKTIKNTKNKQKSTKSQKPTQTEINESICTALWRDYKKIESIEKKADVDFKYHEGMRKIQDEYIDSNFKAIRWLYIILCALVVLLSVCTSVRTNKLETRLTQLEATYEISRRD